MKPTWYCVCLCLLGLWLPLGCGKSAPPPQPTDPVVVPIPSTQELATDPKASPGPNPAGAGVMPAWVADATTAPIPDVPACGMIGGHAFTVAAAEIKEGILTLADSAEFLPDNRFIFFLFLDKGEVPAGKTILVGGKHDFHDPHIHQWWKDAGGKTQSAIAMDKYTLRLEFGAETPDRRLPGKIYLCLPGAEQSRLAGVFHAQIQGFRLINGKADRTSDSLNLLSWLAEEYLQKKHPGKSVRIDQVERSQYESDLPAGCRATGFALVQAIVDQAAPTWVGFTFVRQDDGWAVAGEFDAHQIPEAHPPVTLDPEHQAMAWLHALAAQRFEADLAAKSPAAVIVEFATEFASTGNGVGEGTFRVELADEETPIRRAFRFKRVGAAWEIEAELPVEKK